MTTLSVNKQIPIETGDLNDLPVIAADIIYEGAAVGMSSGYARPLVAGDSFAGIAQAKVDNSVGANGAKNVRVLEIGKMEVVVTGVTGVTNVGATVYASDDDTFTLSSTSNSPIGKIIRHVSSTTCVVAFQAVSRRSL